jgi:hypothetical protein
VTEVTAGNYRVRGLGPGGLVVERHGADDDVLFEQLIEDATTLAARQPCPPGSSVAKIGISQPLIEIIDQARTLKDEFTIVAREPFYLGCGAKLVKTNGDSALPEESLSGGYVYFLGKYDLSKLLEECALKVMSKEAETEYVVHYAINDAPPYWFYDLPSRGEWKAS